MTALIPAIPFKAETRWSLSWAALIWLKRRLAYQKMLPGRQS